MVVQDSTVSKFHNLLLEGLRPYLPVDVRIKDRVEEKWQDVFPGNKVNFTLFPQSATNLRRFETDTRFAYAVPMVEVNGGSTFWCSWSESWRSKRNRDFEFMQAGWVIFAEMGTAEETPILRAEWANDGGEGCAQPHWHFHGQAAVTNGGRPERLNGQSDEEAPPPRSGEVNVTDLHLGMREQTAVTGDACEYPECWRSEIDSTTTVKEWAVRVLRHCQEEMQRSCSG